MYICIFFLVKFDDFEYYSNNRNICFENNKRENKFVITVTKISGNAIRKRKKTFIQLY